MALRSLLHLRPLGRAVVAPLARPAWAARSAGAAAFSSSSIPADAPTTTAPSAAPAMEDEYSSAAHAGARNAVFHLTQPFVLENGHVLPQVDIAYTTYGQLNEQRDNALVLCHALTGDSQVHQWWSSIVEREWTDRYFIVCANVLGSCYGTTGPTSINPLTQRPYGPSFPAITLRDTVRLQKTLLQEELGVRQVQSVIGGSLGGMQTLEWMFLDPEYVKSYVAIACNARHTAWQIGMSELQRQAIYMDPAFQQGEYDPANPPQAGISLARQIAMMSYRTHAAYRDKYGRELVPAEQDKLQTHRKHPYFVVQSYLDYQGRKFHSRFDVNSYLTLTHMMDLHDIGRGRGGVQKALSTVKQPTLVMGVESDVLYPLDEQKEIARALPNAQFVTIPSAHGHDGFLLEQDLVNSSIAGFLRDNL